MATSKSGFTIVELLIVVVVIAILAAISVVAYTNIQTRAQASAIASELRATEKAFNAYKATTGVSSWWFESDASLTGGNVNISGIISNNAEFRSFLQKPPTTTGLGTTASWAYDNDGDTYNGCSNSTQGVNIYLSNVTNLSTAQAVDDAMDDGNLSCGKMRVYGGNLLLYSLSNQR